MTKRMKVIVHYGEDSFTLTGADLRTETIDMIVEDAKTLVTRLNYALELCDKFLEKTRAKE